MIKRYSVKEVEKIFSDANKYQVWLKIELLVLKYHSMQGLLSPKEYEELENDLIVVPNKVREWEKVVHHDVVAFVNHISETTTLKSKKWIHYGLTSSDLVDTGNSVMIQSANLLLIRHIHALVLRLKRMAKVHKYSYMANRITGVGINGATSFGCKIAQYYSDIKEGLKEIEECRKNVECASISGSMGICSHIDPKMQDFVAQELNMYSADCSTQILSRDRYYVFFQYLNRIAQSINSLCMELRLLSRSEIGEVAENFQHRQIGSSSMPHKRNPITLENICGLCRLFDAYCSAFSKNISTWLERDISHSSVDRVVFLDGFSLIVQIVKKFNNVLKKMHVDENMMKKNIKNNFYSVHKQYLCKEIYKRVGNKMSWQEIEKYLDDVNRVSKLNKVGFIELFNSKPESEKLKAPNLFNIHHHLSFIDSFYKNIFKEDDQISCFDTIFYQEHEIIKAIDFIAASLNKKYEKSKKSIRLVAIRDESIVFLSNLLLKLNFPVELCTINPRDKSEKVDFHFAHGQSVIILEGLEKGDEEMKKIKDEINKICPQSTYVVSLFVGLDKSENNQVDLYGLVLPTINNVAGFGIDNGKGRYGNINIIGKLKPNFVNSI